MCIFLFECLQVGAMEGCEETCMHSSLIVVKHLLWKEAHVPLHHSWKNEPMPVVLRRFQNFSYVTSLSWYNDSHDSVYGDTDSFVSQVVADCCCAKVCVNIIPLCLSFLLPK